MLLYHKIQKIDGATLLLDNGTKLQICPNQGCGGCNNGWYDIDELNECDNAITDVKFEAISENGYAYIYQIFVYAENKEIKLLEVSGNDGNGYYGSGYRINVIAPVREQEENYDYEER